MPRPRRIYLLDPKLLSPETIAVAFAKTSRSPQAFDEIAAELSDEKSADFHEKWVVGYGHSSVAEHAVLHIAVENISRLAVECLESNRLASYTEKSSRYQVWSNELFHLPEEFSGNPLEKDYLELCETLFGHYQTALEKVVAFLKKENLKQESESIRSYQQRLRSTAADSCRYYLPACALANVGITINARALEHAITKMLSHPLHEVKKIGDEVRTVSQGIVPTLVKYANENDYLKHFEDEYPVKNFGMSSQNEKDPDDWFACVDCDAEGEDRVLAALLYRFSGYPFGECLGKVQELARSEKEKLSADLLGKVGDHDIPLRELEYAGITFDILMDQGAYFEFKRHRMMSQTPQKLSTLYGFATPKLLADAGVSEGFNEDMENAGELYQRLAEKFPHVASYIIPNAYNRRVLVKMNLRSALHFVKLRSAANAHFAIRRVAVKILGELNQRFPIFANYFAKSSQESIRSIEQDYFTKPN